MFYLSAINVGSMVLICFQAGESTTKAILLLELAFLECHFSISLIVDNLYNFFNRGINGKCQITFYRIVLELGIHQDLLLVGYLSKNLYYLLYST